MDSEPNSGSQKYMIWFFAGGETRDNKFNVFTGSFIRLMSRIMAGEFDYIRGIYFRWPFMNVIWALNNSQKPIADPARKKITATGLKQLLSQPLNPDTRLIIVSSSFGSTAAAQTACFLAQMNSYHQYLKNPFHLALGSTLISKESLLYKQLAEYQKTGMIGSFIYDDLQDPGDSTTGVGGTTRKEAWLNAVGLIAPFLSAKYSGPSFLNTDPENGHLHRKRSQTVQKAIDYINVLLVKNKLAGEKYLEKAEIIINEENKNSKMPPE